MEASYSKTLTTKISIKEKEYIIDKIKNNKIIILPTDTIYGISSSALEYNNLIKINNIKQRDHEQNLIILFSSYEQLLMFVKLNDQDLKTILKYEDKYQSQPTSFLVDVNNLINLSQKNLKNKKILFRVVKHKILKDIIEKSGPIYSTSVNIKNETPIIDISKLESFNNVDLICYDLVENKNIKSSIIYDVENKKKIR